MAFEAIVKKQIERLKEPSLKCVDLVVNELASVVRGCAECVNRYPRLRDCVEQIVTNYMRQQEAFAKQQIAMIVDYELAYMLVFMISIYPLNKSLLLFFFLSKGIPTMRTLLDFQMPKLKPPQLAQKRI